MVLEVLDAVLSQPVLPAADEAADQILAVFRHVGDLLRELEALLHDNGGFWCVNLKNKKSHKQMHQKKTNKHKN